MKVLVCGGRDFKDEDLLYEILDDMKPTCIITGECCTGADDYAKFWARKHGIPLIGMEANFDYYGNPGGPIRNGWLLKYTNPDLILAFPGGKGTADMLRQAEKAGVPTRIIKHDSR